MITKAATPRIVVILEEPLEFNVPAEACVIFPTGPEFFAWESDYRIKVLRGRELGDVCPPEKAFASCIRRDGQWYVDSIERPDSAGSGELTVIDLPGSEPCELCGEPAVTLLVDEQEWPPQYDPAVHRSCRSYTMETMHYFCERHSRNPIVHAWTTEQVKSQPFGRVRTEVEPGLELVVTSPHVPRKLRRALQTLRRAARDIPWNQELKQALRFVRFADRHVRIRRIPSEVAE